MINQKFDFQLSFSIVDFIASSPKLLVLDLPFKQTERS